MVIETVFFFLLESRTTAVDSWMENARLLLTHSTAYPFTQQMRRILRCCFCSNTYADPAEFRCHMDSDHDIDRTSIVVKGVIIRVDVTDLKCKICFKYCDTLEIFAEHAKTDHGIPIDTSSNLGLVPMKLEKDRFACYLCGKNFMALYGLYLHSKTHFPKLIICDICGRNFETKRGLKVHVLNNHTGSRDNSEFYCIYCKKSFPSKEAKKEHVLTSKLCLQFRCKRCPLRFSSQSMLYKHMTLAHGEPEKTFPCAQCNSVFHTRNVLYLHFKREHTDDCKCQHCGMTFGTRRDLEDHIASRHTYQCNDCEKSFLTARNLKKHSQIHYNIPKLPCLVCNKLFTDRFKVIDHVKKQHPEAFIQQYG